jgi:hypothetical protein
MRLSELISAAQAALDEDGDVEVKMITNEGFPFEYFTLGTVSLSDIEPELVADENYENTFYVVQDGVDGYGTTKAWEIIRERQANNQETN